VSYGKSGAFGRFVPGEPLTLRRGQQVVVHTLRGLEIGTVLCPVTPSHRHSLNALAPGRLLRLLTQADRQASAAGLSLAQQLFDASRRLVHEQGLAIEILDAEVLLDGRLGLIQFLGKETSDLEGLAQRLIDEFRLEVRFENLAVPVEAPQHGCGKPDCGQASGGGCSTCSSAGGCSTCGAGPVELRDYFAHLRTNMEQRKPLL
jgi:cell fate regulator YaaT (PSP1 superfamily)